MATNNTKWSYLFSELDEAQRRVTPTDPTSPTATWDAVRGLLGGKGANLADMVRIGIPVPPGFIVTTEACNAFLAEGSRFPPSMWEQVQESLSAVERATGKRLGDPENPLLLSCRSGAKFSMPGMMDTVLNIGLNDAVAEGLCRLTGDRRFVFDAYRRLLQMFGTVVLGLPDEPFEAVLKRYRSQRSVHNDANLSADDLAAITDEFKSTVKTLSGRQMPSDPNEQLRLATEAVFKSWNGKRAIDYRNAAGIAHNLGTAVNIVAMIFGNLGEDSGTGVATTRNVSTGEPELEGDYLTNAQGEDVVSGTRQTERIAALGTRWPALFAEFRTICEKLERHYRDVQDIEFTIERGKLWILQTRDAKRTARAAVRLAVDLANEGLIQREEAVLRVSPAHVEFFLHPQCDPAAKKEAQKRGDKLGTGLNVSPGAAVGQLAFDADTAEHWAKIEKKAVVLARAETKPDDVHGILAGVGVLTSHGGRTSHAALVARQFGKPAVVGASALDIDPQARTLTVGDRVLREGDWVTIDGSTGEVFAGQLRTEVQSMSDPHLLTLLGWADSFRRLGVWANADYPVDAQKARSVGAQGIGLCRTEHMFFQTDRLPHMQAMILARSDAERAAPLAALLPFQRSDFEGLFRAMDGLPVTIRLIDPPLHEFLPSHDDLLREVTEAETRIACLDGETSEEKRELERKRQVLAAVEKMREQNPMLGLRGVRLGIHLPALVRMQVQAIFEAACTCAAQGIVVKPKIMIPLVATKSELRIERRELEQEAKRVMAARNMQIPYQFGTMIEVPRAALTADQIAEYAEFFSFGTNDLTQTTFGISRDDAEAGFLLEYLEKGILGKNPFATLDEAGVGKLMQMAVTLGRQTRQDLEIGICGEHGGDPDTIAFCHRIGLDYVSCSPYRVPVARLAAAHAALKAKKTSTAA
ncbi:MAG: pyruvate, phosphate dikinase [Myxococcales bacterium]|nr:pyruvate, phosphate dikinase [Myxococcales bacterium]